jgi:hypothetical protein
VQLLGSRKLMWTDPTNWMNRAVFPPGNYLYRHVGEKDDGYVRRFLQ